LKQAKATAANKYDSFDEEILKALSSLYASLSDPLMRRIKKLSAHEDAFASIWLRLADVLLLSMSSCHYDDIREKVRKCTPTSFAQENIELMVESIKITDEFIGIFPRLFQTLLPMNSSVFSPDYFKLYIPHL